MPLNGTAFAQWANRFAAYAEGEVPLVLVAVAVGGADVPFVHDEAKTNPALTEPGAIDRPTLGVMTRARLVTTAQYAYDGETWTVEDVEPEAMGGAAWPHRATLVAHAH